MPMVKGAPDKMNTIMEAAYQEALKKYPKNKSKASKIAFGAAKNAGYKQVNGKWMLNKKEMSEMIKKEFEIFATGKYPQGEFTDAQLDEIVSTYDPVNLHEAPQTIGHVSDHKDSTVPAVGWIEKLKKVGNKIVAIGDFTEQLVSAVKNGEFKKRSIGLYSPNDASNPTPGKWHLHHVAWLGAQPPQVKGLADVAFSQFEEDRNEPIDIEFADMKMEDMEVMANEDTCECMQECCARCCAAIEDCLNSDIDDEQKRDKCCRMIWDCCNEMQNEINLHFHFLDKAETIVEKKKAGLKEMVERLVTKLTITKQRKESPNMDDKQKLEFDEAKKTLETEKLALAEAQKTLDAQKKEVEAKQTEFAEKEKQEKALKVKAQVEQFREELKGKNYPIKKMEEQGIFALAEQLLSQEAIEFGEKKEKKAPIDILKSLTDSFKPVPVESEFKEETIKTFGDLAKEYGISGQVDVKTMQVLQFTEGYVQKNLATIPGKDLKEKRAYVQTQINMGELKVDPTILQ